MADLKVPSAFSLESPAVDDLGARQAVEWVRARNPWANGSPWARTHTSRMYALGAGARWLQPPARFVIVTPGRSGSELLTDLLGSHPDIVCDAEILRQRLVLPEHFVAGRAAKAGLAGARAYGFKMHCGHFGYQVLRERDHYLRQLSGSGAHVIFLRRDNVVAQAISSTIALRTRWHWRRQDGAAFTPLELDPVEILMMAYLFEESDRYLAQMVADLPHLTLNYEDDLHDGPAQQASVDRICDLLGVRRAPTATDHVRFTPRTLSETVANFGAVADLIRPTRFARFLEEGDGPATPAAAPEAEATAPIGTPEDAAQHSRTNGAIGTIGTSAAANATPPVPDPQGSSAGVPM